jgi:ribosomal protein L11 methyltransferase
MNEIIRISIPEIYEPEQESMMAILLSEIEIEGFEQLQSVLFIYIIETKFNRELLTEILQRQNRSFSVDTIQDQNWNAVWESNFEPVRVADFCMIRAAFHVPPEGVQFDIIITPKMSFGTGHHATTFQVIQAMEKLSFVNKNVLDFGTGTGVLAILAEKLGASDILAIDNDSWSIENAMENISVNKCLHIKLVQTEELPVNEYDIILANINKNVLAANMHTLAGILKSNGKLVLSGILNQDLPDMKTAISINQLQIETVCEMDNWLCISVKKNEFLEP